MSLATASPRAAESNVGLLGADIQSQWRLPNETPVAFVYNQRNYAVMLATPKDIVDFVVGFSLTEGVINSVDEILAIDISHTERGIDLRIRLTQPAFDRFSLRDERRNLPGNAGCGLCGLESADRLFKKLPIVSETPLALTADAINRAIATLPELQVLNAETRSVHAAAWVGLDGSIKISREDVGRHNAVDKLLGAIMIAGADTRNGFMLVSSRWFI